MSQDDALPLDVISMGAQERIAQLEAELEAMRAASHSHTEKTDSAIQRRSNGVTEPFQSEPIDEDGQKLAALYVYVASLDGGREFILPGIGNGPLMANTAEKAALLLTFAESHRDEQREISLVRFVRASSVEV